jgi:hypothetical protein
MALTTPRALRPCGSFFIWEPRCASLFKNAWAVLRDFSQILLSRKGV